MRIAAKNPDQFPWYLRPFFRAQERKYGQVLQGSLLWARVPKLFLALAAFYGVLERRSSPLDPALRSLVMMRVSQLNWCHACVDIHSAGHAQRAGSLRKVEAIDDWRDSPLFDARERAVLAYAEAITDSRQQVTDAHVNALRAHFDDEAIVELTALVAFQNLSSKFNNALDVPAQGFCRIPAAATRSA